MRSVFKSQNRAPISSSEKINRRVAGNGRDLAVTTTRSPLPSKPRSSFSAVQQDISYYGNLNTAAFNGHTQAFAIVQRRFPRGGQRARVGSLGAFMVGYSALVSIQVTSVI